MSPLAWNGKAFQAVGYITRKELYTMKKIFCALMVVAMLATMSTTAFAATIDTSTGSSQADVKAKYNSTTPADVYSVDVTWGAMEFDYNAGGQKWDTENHKWVADEAAPAGWEVKNSSNTIKLANHSSKAVNATFAFAANAEYTDLDGGFTYNSAALTSALELELPQADTAAKEYVVSFNPNGSIPATHSATTYAKIGSITITLG